jgi:hypothetical protein
MISSQEEVAPNNKHLQLVAGVVAGGVLVCGCGWTLSATFHGLNGVRWFLMVGATVGRVIVTLEEPPDCEWPPGSRRL